MTDQVSLVRGFTVLGASLWTGLVLGAEVVTYPRPPANLSRKTMKSGWMGRKWTSGLPGCSIRPLRARNGTMADRIPSPISTCPGRSRCGSRRRARCGTPWCGRRSRASRSRWRMTIRSFSPWMLPINSASNRTAKRGLCSSLPIRSKRDPAQAKGPHRHLLRPGNLQGRSCHRARQPNALPGRRRGSQRGHRGPGIPCCHSRPGHPRQLGLRMAQGAGQCNSGNQRQQQCRGRRHYHSGIVALDHCAT